MAKKSAPPAALASRNEVEPENESQEVEQDDLIDSKLEKELKAAGKIRDPEKDGKFPKFYRACVQCGRGIHSKTEFCPLCGATQPRKEPNPNAGSRGRRAAAPAPTIDDMFAILDATIAFANEYDSVDQAIDDIDSVLDFLDVVGGRDRAISMLERYRDRKSSK